MNKHIISMCELSSYKCEMIKECNCVVEIENRQRLPGLQHEGIHIIRTLVGQIVFFLSKK